MPYVLNGAPLEYGQDVVIDDMVYSYETLLNMAASEREALGVTWVEPEPPVLTVEQLCAAIDAERDRRTILDFAHNFGATLAFDDERTRLGPGFGQEIEADERQLQMRPEDRANWQTLQGAALTAVVGGQPNAILPMRAEDNWNIQTTALQVLGVLAAMTEDRAALLFAGGALKSQQRAIYPEVVDITTGWPT